MDIIDAHFAAENAADIPAILATYTDDVYWEDTTLSLGILHGRRAVGVAYANLMSILDDLHLESTWRVHSTNTVIDESVVTGRVVGSIGGVTGGGTAVHFRLLHVFEIRDGLICGETAWYDTGGIIRQIQAAGASGRGQG